MTEFILVRHGEPTYDEVVDAGFRGHGLALAPLSDKGIKEVKEIAKNDIFKNSDILISSPYTRAMQTASIIAKENDLDVNVEVLLHEWIPDLSNNYNTTEEFLKLIRLAKDEYVNSKNVPDFKFSDKTESLLHVRQRAFTTLEKYINYDKVIVVCHGLLISTLFKEKVKLHTGDFVMVTSDYLEENFSFNSKVRKK